MRKFFLATILFLSLFFFGARSSTPIFASGDLKVVSQNDVMYVSTQSDASTSAVASDSTAISTTSAIQRAITLPKGFFQDFGQLINSLLKVVLVIAALLVFGFLIYGGLQWITSGGEKGKTEAARNKIVAAIVGLIILAASYAILTLALRFLGFKDLNDVINNAGTINGPSSSNATTSSQLRNLNLLK